MTARMASPRKGSRWEVFNAADQRRKKRKAKAKRIGAKKPTHSQLVKRADAIFGAQVRSVGFCESGRLNHAGPLQCAHGFSRRYEATRWNRLNAWCLCAGCHVYFTHRPLEWDEWMRDQMWYGYEDLRTLALKGGKQDLEQILAGLERKTAA